MGDDAGVVDAGEASDAGDVRAGTSSSESKSKGSGIFSRLISSGIGAATAKSSIPLSGAATTAAKGAGWSAGSGATSRAYDAIDDPGFWLFAGGLLTFFWAHLLSDVVALMLATLFMFYTTFFIFKGRGLVVVLSFFIVYIY